MWSRDTIAKRLRIFNVFLFSYKVIDLAGDDLIRAVVDEGAVGAHADIEFGCYCSWDKWYLFVAGAEDVGCQVGDLVVHLAIFVG